MIDVPDRIRDYLLTQTALTALTSTRIWAERNEPPPGYAPSVGGGIAFRVRGGQVPAYPGVLVFPSAQFKCYGTNEQTANTLYRTLFDVLHDKKSAYFLECLAEGIGQTLPEEDTGWIFNLSFFQFTMLNS